VKPFIYEASPSRVVFGSNTIGQLPFELERLGCHKALVLSTQQQKVQAGELAASLGRHAAGSFFGAVMHTPIDVTEQALVAVRDLKADCVIAVGGGSTTGLGKAIALRTDLPQIVIPTTYAGSEMTSILGESKDGVKTTQKSPKILPEVVIYDVNLTLSLPPSLSTTSGINAIAHAVEALYAEDRNPIVSLMAEQGISALAGAIPRIVASPFDQEARSDALYGAWLCGVCLGAVGMALHHKLCHTLGGAFDLPHAETHTILLPHSIAYNAAFALDAVVQLERALSTSEPAKALFELASRIGAPRALRDIGMPESGIDHAADLAVRNPYWNPRPIERDAIRGLIARAWAGEPPAVGARA
jgi:alcohol dehydrogenase class IV